MQARNGSASPLFLAISIYFQVDYSTDIFMKILQRGANIRIGYSPRGL